MNQIYLQSSLNNLQQTTKIETKTNFYTNLLNSRNLFIILHHNEYLVTKIETIGDKLQFFCAKFVSSFDEKLVKIKF